MTEHRYCYDDGSYMLGALGDVDQADFEQHLTGCTMCRDSVAALTGLPDMLAKIGLGDLSEAEPVPATLLPELRDEFGAGGALLTYGTPRQRSAW